MQPSLEIQHQISESESDHNGLWRPEAIFQRMQELAGDHSMLLGCGRDVLFPQGIVWMLARIQLHMQQYPQTHETIQMQTWPGPAGRITFPRYFTFTTQQGAVLGCAATSWMLVDYASRRILPAAKANLSFPDTSHLIPPLPEPQRFRLSQQGAVSHTSRAPLYGDIDRNGHMNNASYAGWICDLFPLSRHTSGRIVDLSISYAAEAVPGEQVAMTLYQQGDSFEVMGEDTKDKHIIFEARGQWGRCE